MMKNHVADRFTISNWRARNQNSVMSMININIGPDGWLVRVVRDGEEHSRYFRFSDGGKQKALKRAKEYRDKLHKKLGPRKWKKGPRKKAVNNTSGVTGVSKNKYGRWVATWQEAGKQRFKTFAKKYEAVEFRRGKVKSR